MRSYSYGKPSGRKIGNIGNYDLHPGTIAKKTSKSIRKTVKENNTAFNFVYGPSTGGLMESTQFNVLTTGESIKNISSDPLFKNRDLKVLGRNVEDVIPLIERVNGPFTASHSVAFLGAVEDAMEIEVDDNVLWERVIEIELERIRNHLHVAARMCEAAAFGVPYNTLFYLREKVNRIIKRYAGHRFFHDVNKIGTVDLNPFEVSKHLEDIKNEAKDTYSLLRESKIFVDRLLNNGIVRDSECLGPVARGCGYSYDARMDSDTLPYVELDFSPVTETEGIGDAMDRFIVRFEEIFQSMEIIQDAEKKLNEHKVNVQCRNEGNCEGVGRVESPSGDIAYLLKLDGTQINDISMLTPSKVNLPVFLESTHGNVFTDFHFNWESFGIWISEIGVDFV